MYERVVDWYLQKPDRITATGMALAHAGGILLLLAAFAHVFLVVASLGPDRPDTLAQLGLPLPTFFVPESIVGIVFAVALSAIGVVIAQIGAKYERLYRSM